MMLHDIGVVGMAVMGSNLALNMADHGYDVAVYNYTPDLTEKFLKERPHDKIHVFLNSMNSWPPSNGRAKSCS